MGLLLPANRISSLEAAKVEKDDIHTVKLRVYCGRPTCTCIYKLVTFYIIQQSSVMGLKVSIACVLWDLCLQATFITARTVGLPQG